MKWINKNLSIGILILVLTLAPIPVWGQTAGKVTTEDAARAVQEMMEEIMTRYVGSEVTPEMLRDAALKGMFGILDDYSEYYTPKEYQDFVTSLSGEFVGVGIQIHMKEENIEVVRPLKDSPGAKAGILAGDIIQKVDGKEIQGLSLDQVVSMIRGKQGSKVKLTVRRGTQTKEFTITRALIKDAGIHVQTISEIFPKTSKDATKHMRYIAITSFNAQVAEDLRRELRQATAQGVTHILFDVRDNPGGYLDQVIEICKMLVPKGPIVHTVTKEGDMETFSSSLQKVPFNMVVLINGNSASASEIFAGALKDSGAGTLVGQTTFGKGIVQQTGTIDGNLMYKMTIQEYLTRNQNHIHKKGIEPDIKIEFPTLLEATSKPLKIKDTGKAVEKVEKILQFLGYDVGVVDERFDTKTHTAVFDFQNLYKLPATGQVDKDTIKKINEVVGKALQEKDRVLEKGYEILKQMK